MLKIRHIAAALMIAAPGAATAESFTCRTPNDDVVSRVVGGQFVAHEDAPYQVAVRAGRSLCGGSIISRSFVLTAAHCVFDEFATPFSPSKIEVLYGSARLSDMSVSRVLRVDSHPDYNPRARVSDGDVAILTLAVPMEVPRSAAVVLATERTHSALVREGGCARVTGFGKTATDGISRRLQAANVPVYTPPGCGSSGDHMTDRMICAGFKTGGRDSCNGDSGGPLVVRDGPVRWLQIGVVSFGPKNCGEAGAPGVYARVASFVDWIISVTRR